MKFLKSVIMIYVPYLLLFTMGFFLPQKLKDKFLDLCYKKLKTHMDSKTLNIY